MAFCGSRPLVLNDPATQVPESGMGGGGESGSPGTLQQSGNAMGLSGHASTNDIRVKVHPVVLFSILDHFLRRPMGQKRVIGTLLGKVNANVVEVTNSFAVPHQEVGKDEVAVGKEFNSNMFALLQLVNPMEKIVGWYATAYDGKQVVDSSSLIHEFFTQACESPIHLVVDTSFSGNAVGCKAFISTPLEIRGESLANIFHQLLVEKVTTEAERICLDRMIRGQEGCIFSTAQGGDGLAPVDTKRSTLETSMSRLLGMLREVRSYVDGVVSGKHKGDPHIGRLIAASVASIPQMQPEAFVKLFDSNLQDLLMVTYLSSLTKAQLSIAEKLQM